MPKEDVNKKTVKQSTAKNKQDSVVEKKHRTILSNPKVSKRVSRRLQKEQESIGRAEQNKQGLLESLTIRLSHTEKLMFIKYLSVLLRSGLAMNDALQIIYDQSKKKPLRTIVGTLQSVVQSGRTLADGFSRYPQVFNSVYINLVAAGEVSGTLQLNLEHLSTQIQKEHELRQKIRGALMYPMVILCVAIVMTIGIVVFVLPNITDVFETLDVTLPLTTRMLLWIARLIEVRGWLVLLSFLAFILTIYFIRKIKPFKPFLHTVLVYVPVVGTIVRNTNLARLSRLLGTMLESGETVSDAIPIAQSVLNNARYRKLLAGIQENVRQGEPMAKSMESYERFFPLIMQHMTRVGEETGTLSGMMMYLAEFYEQEVDDSMRNLSNMLEPIMLLIIGILVGGLALSIISPIYQVVGNV